MKNEAKSLSDEFDAVIMLTWSDWKTEPRSNRYHYASRFAKSLPVLFVQPWLDTDSSITLEPTEIDGIELVHTSAKDIVEDPKAQRKMVAEFRAVLRDRGIHRPLFWIYNTMDFKPILDAFPKAFRVYHGTEDYLTNPSGREQSMPVVAESVIDMLSQINFTVCVTHGVLDSIQKIGGYNGPSVVTENGCDAQFYFDCIKDLTVSSVKKSRHSAIFQGGINNRVDYALLLDLVRQMPDWDFVFCGLAADWREWDELLLERNVKYKGSVDPETLAKEVFKATVGLITFVQSPIIYNTLPLKAYEYCACGLPVVTMPIQALENKPDLFTIATTADEFEASLRKLADTRFDQNWIEVRKSAAQDNSYDSRYAAMERELLSQVNDLKRTEKDLSIGVLYDSETSMHVGTIREHLDAFRKYSTNIVTYIPASKNYWTNTGTIEVDGMFDIFDVVVVHYSLRTSVPGHIDNKIGKALENYNGYKVLYIQDEYEGILQTRDWMKRMSFDLVYTCVPNESVNAVYPAKDFPNTEFIQTLTGYVPEGQSIDRFCTPLSERPLAIAYRGRELPAIYGRLGHEKFIIGKRMKEITQQRGIPADIEVDLAKRVYGSQWYQFIGSARATLGTESGSNIFDFDGSIAEKISNLTKKNPDVSFDEIWEQVLAPHEEKINMRQVSPKIFEAIKLKTALILFEGNYSGVVKANDHYIPLNKDFSNVDEVLNKLNDDVLIGEMTERAYQDIIASGLYSYRQFIENLDADLNARTIGRQKELWVGPTIIIDKLGNTREVLPTLPFGLRTRALPAGIIAPKFSKLENTREVLPILPFNLSIRALSDDNTFSSPVLDPSSRYLRRYLRRLWHLLPKEFRYELARRVSKIAERLTGLA
jgi:hypothetical protein